MIHWLIESAQDMQEKPEWFLSKTEQAKFATFQFDKRRDEWLLGRWTAKRLIQAMLLQQNEHVVALDAIEISNDADGVPSATRNAEPVTPNLSISHSFDHALCAASATVVGADLERIEPREQNLVNDFFTANEIARVNASAAETRNVIINAIWSAKEAALKALHKGLSVDTRVVEISIAPFENAPEQWTLFQINFASGDAAWAPMQGWWRVLDGFILTLAAHVQDTPDSAELVPETYLVSHAPAHQTHAAHRIGHAPHHPTHHEN